MARNTTSSRAYNKVFYGKLVGFKPNDVQEPGVELKTKDDGQYKVVEVAPSVSGCLKNVELSTYEYEGDTIQQFKLEIVDDENKETYVINFNFNNSTRGILNCLSMAEDYTMPLRLSFYRNKAGYASIFVEQEQLDSTWQKLPFKWEYEKYIAPMIKTVKVGKKEMKDYTKVDEAFIKLITDVIQKKKFYGGERDSDPAVDAPFEKTTTVTNTEPETDDLPF